MNTPVDSLHPAVREARLADRDISPFYQKLREGGIRSLAGKEAAHPS